MNPQIPMQHVAVLLQLASLSGLQLLPWELAVFR